jgi:DNA-binding NarL/FixJ family response regulator
MVPRSARQRAFPVAASERGTALTQAVAVTEKSLITAMALVTDTTVPEARSPFGDYPAIVKVVGETDRTSSGPVPQEHLARVYRFAATHGPICAFSTVADDVGLDVDEVADAVEQLMSSRLLRADDGRGAVLVAVDPDIAAALHVSPIELEIAHRREQIAQIQDWRESFRGDYARGGHGPAAPGAVEQLAGGMEVRGSVKIAGDACVDEVLVLQSGKQDTEEFEDLLHVCGQLLARGVRVRIICQHRSRADLTTRMNIKTVSAAGAVVRTVSHLPRAAVVFDRSVAVLLGSTEGQPAASRVCNAEVVQFLLDVFNHLWDSATPVECFESGYAEVADDLRRTIASLMAKGFTDEVLARKLGMSVRTCRRHIAALMQDLGAVSRFQAGVEAGRRNLVVG